MIDAGLPQWIFSRPAMIVAAHPDDETLGLGTLLPHFRNLRAIVHVTDGAPRRGSDVADAGASSCQEYAALRRCEFYSAMQRAGIRGIQFICLQYPDQEVSYHLQALTRKLALLFRRLRPRLVFTHSYEGGHPDHDACAASVRWACSLVPKERPAIVEFAGYHAGSDGHLVAERFLSGSQHTWERRLSEAQRQFKCSLISTFTTQQRVLCQFPLHSEPVRVAPQHNFTKPPHAGKLYYENFDWGMTGCRWRRFASRAIALLGFAGGR